MADKVFNAVNFPAGFNINLAQPIDSRMIVDVKDNLTNSDYWNNDTYPIKLFNGLICAVQSTGEVYVLIDASTYTDENSWKKVGADFNPSDFEITWGEIPTSTGA